jgi:adenylate cyclase
MARLTLCLLGSFEATLDGQPLTAFESDKVRGLLAYLGVESGRAHSREKLAGLLWPDSSETAARANLSHVLTNLRQVLGDRDAQTPFVLASRQSVQFNRESDALVDVTAFEELSPERQRYSAGLGDPSRADLTPERQRYFAGLEQAVALCRGRFLEGFSLPGSSEFEEWLLLEQEHLHRLAMGALARLAMAYEAEGQLQRALTFAWRQLELDPWWESAHRQAMRLLASSGQRDAALAQYQACCRLLDEELAAKPAHETVCLYEQIRDGQLPALRAQPAAPHELQEPSFALPGFLTGQAPAVARSVFVAREPELAWLDGLLQAALEGRGQAAFVVGGPGRGKTVLLQEFARRAMDAHPDLLLSMGTCNAYSGVGDPYLPFRGVLAMLTGDAEAPWASGILSTEQARRMWDAMPDAVQVLSRRGSGLIGTLLPGRELLARACAAAPAGADWLPPLERLRSTASAVADPCSNPPGSLEQSHLFEQYANVLLDLSAQHPLLLVLDDLQWADLASISLFFHLGRRIGRGRILLAGAYRPHELALGRDGQRHPLEPALAEYRTRFGDAWLDLAAADEAQGRLFVDCYLDTEPNALDAQFREALCGRTQGHALFTVELLRAMQQRGDLVQDQAGRWVPGDQLEWGALPARAEAAIAERIDRLPEELREILAVASVEGEEFTAQAVALVQGIDELRLLRALRVELAARHRLVREQGERSVGGRRLSLYRFAHFLFQQHLYQELGEAERRLLHRRVGEALERLYEGRLEEVAVELARHFAGDPEREQRYTRMAGERAAARFANEEAVRYLSCALELTPCDERRERYELLLAREKVRDLLGQRDAQHQELAELKELADGLGMEEQAELRVWLGRVRFGAAAYAEAWQQFEAALELARAAGEQRLEAQALGGLGRISYMQDAYLDAGRLLRESLVLAQETGDEATQALNAFYLGCMALFLQRMDEARNWAESSHVLSEKIGDRRGVANALRMLGHVARGQGDRDKAKRLYSDALALAEEIGDRGSAANTLLWLGELAYFDYRAPVEARAYSERSKAIAEEIGARGLVAGNLGCLGWDAIQAGEYGEAEAYLEEARGICREIGDRFMLAQAQTRLGYVLGLQGRRDAGWALLVQELRESMASELSAQIVPWILELVGLVGVHLGRFQRGAQLLGLGFRLDFRRELTEVMIERELDMARGALGAEGLEAALARGAALDLDQVVAEILACDTPEAYWATGPERAAAGSEGTEP